MGDQSASSNSLSPIYSSALLGTWGGWAENNKTDNPFISRRFNKRGKYRIYCTMEITNSANEPIAEWSKATIAIIKNNTSQDWQSSGGTQLAKSAEVQTQGNVVTIDAVITVERGDKITLLGSNYSVYGGTLSMTMSYKVFAEYPSYASPSDVGIVYHRTLNPNNFTFVPIQKGHVARINWTSSPIPGDLAL